MARSFGPSSASACSKAAGGRYVGARDEGTSGLSFSLNIPKAFSAANFAALVELQTASKNRTKFASKTVFYHHHALGMLLDELAERLRPFMEPSPELTVTEALKLAASDLKTVAWSLPGLHDGDAVRVFGRQFVCVAPPNAQF